MLGSVLLMLATTAVMLLVPATVGLLRAGRHTHRAAVGDSRRRARLGCAAVLVGLGALGSTTLMRAGPATAALVAVVLAGAVLAGWRLSRMWAVRGVVVWALLVAGTVGFVGWLALRVVGSSGSLAELLVGCCGWLVLVLAVARVRRHLIAEIAQRALRARPEPPGRPPSRPAPWLTAVFAVAGVTLALAVAGPGPWLDRRSPSSGGTPREEPGGGTPAAAHPTPTATADAGRDSRRSLPGEGRSQRGSDTGSGPGRGPATPTPTEAAATPAVSAPSPQATGATKTPGYAKDNPNRPEHAGPPGSGHGR